MCLNMFFGISYSGGKSGPQDFEPTPRIARSIQTFTKSFSSSSNECKVVLSCSVVKGLTEQENGKSAVTLNKSFTARYLQA